MSATNELFGKNVDSIKTCDCVVPAFYAYLQSDPNDLKKFNTNGFRGLEKSKADRYASLYQTCILENIVDTNAKFIFTPKIREQFKIKLRDSLAVQLAPLPEHRIDNLCDCLLKSLDNKLTVKELLTASFTENETLTNALRLCQF